MTRRTPPQPKLPELSTARETGDPLWKCRRARARLGQACGLPTFPQPYDVLASLAVYHSPTNHSTQSDAGSAVPVLSRLNSTSCPTFIPAFTAAAIGVILRRRGYEVDLASVSENPSTEGCAGVQIGSAVNGGQWLPEAVTFVRNNHEALGKLPVALFTVHIMNAGTDERSRSQASGVSRRGQVRAAPSRRGILRRNWPRSQARLLDSALVLPTLRCAGEGDCRDWEAIRGWACTVLAFVLEKSNPSPLVHTH
jgi:menaquinone-dependent protoporphyrinogen oxidase